MNNFPAGSKGKVTLLQPYFNITDPMPMLRPADLISLGYKGIVCDHPLAAVTDSLAQRFFLAKSSIS